LRAVSIISAVGSVQYCSLRFANNSYLTKIPGPLEIISLSGTIDKNQNPHIHIGLSDG
jgi:predicted DNA-binding protein with PD1-like motif